MERLKLLSWVHGVWDLVFRVSVKVLADLVFGVFASLSLSFFFAWLCVHDVWKLPCCCTGSCFDSALNTTLGLQWL